jgi:hypothetical protein
MFRRSSVLIAIVLMACTGVALAATTSRMTGTVQDDQGLPLPGVTVQISSDKLIGGPQVAVTDGNGSFVFNLLPPGHYTVEANLAGFRPAAGELQVALDRTASITFQMVPESFAGEIVVEERVPVVDTTQVNSSVVFDEQFLKNASVGSAGRDYLSVLTQAAGVTNVSGGGGNPSVFGGSVGDNAYLIDGLNTSDPLLGTFGTNFNFDAIQEMNFQTGGFEAEFGQATGGIVNLVTKSGGNDFSGSLDIRFRNEQMTENGDHYNKDEQDTQTQNISGTLGGPILRDRLWFFVSLENIDNVWQGEDVLFPWNYKGWNYIGKMTWQAAQNHRVIVKYSGDPAEIPGANAAQFIDPTGSGTQEQGGDIVQAELNSVLSESTLLNFQAGAVRQYLSYGPSHGDVELNAHINDDTLWLSNSAESVQDSDRDRNEYRAHITHFVDDFAGAHELKAGVEYNDLFFGGELWFSGDARVHDENPRFPDSAVDLNDDGYISNYYLELLEPLANARQPVDSYGEIYTFFVQDAWRPTPNLTVKPGIRLDNVQLANSVGEDIADMDRWQPRLGVAWDLFGNARHVVRASAGRFMDPTALSIPDFASGVPLGIHEYNELEFYCNRVGLCDPNSPAIPGDAEPYYFTTGAGITYVLFDNRTNVDANQVFEPAWTLDQAGVGSLQAPYADELIIAYETQLAPETSLELSYVNKETEEIIEDTCINNTWVYGGGPMPSLDDPDTWTTAEGCDRFLIANVPQFYRKYEGYTLKAETRRGSWHMLASYTYSDSTGNTFNGPRQSYATELADFFPVHFANIDGNMPDQSEHRVKLNGFFLLPHRWTIGFDGFWSAPGYEAVTSTCDAFQDAMGFRSTVDQMAELGIDPGLLAYCSTADDAFLANTDILLRPRGDFETKSTWQLDLQFSKSWTVAGMDLTGVLTVLNVFSRELDRTFNDRAFRQDTEIDDDGNPVPLNYQDDDPSAPYYDEYYGGDGSPVLVPVGAPLRYSLPRRYEIGFRLEF